MAALAGAVGIVVAVPFVAWWAHDFSRIPGRLWFWTGYDRHAWQWAMLLGLVAGGWIAVVTAVRWRWSETRAVLLDELAEHPGLRHGRPTGTGA